MTNKRASDQSNRYFLAGAVSVFLLFATILYEPSSTDALIWWSVAKGALIMLLLGMIGVCAVMGFACLVLSSKDNQ